MSAEEPFRIQVRNHDRAAIISLAGELDLASAPALQEELERLGGTDAEIVILDLSELTFMDSTGLSTLVKAHQQAEEAGKRFGVVKGGHQVQRLLHLTGVDSRLTVVESPEELLQES